MGGDYGLWSVVDFLIKWQGGESWSRSVSGCVIFIFIRRLPGCCAMAQVFKQGQNTAARGALYR